MEKERINVQARIDKPLQAGLEVIKLEYGLHTDSEAMRYIIKMVSDRITKKTTKRKA